MRSSHQRPFKLFGEQIKTLREKSKESLLEVSSAVEIDEFTLKEIEFGSKLPDEDILILLMNHFNVKDKDAVTLWELAGYGKEETKDLNEEQLLKQIMMVVPVDNRVSYSDSAHISANKNGVVIDFKLSAGNNKPQIISRVGMGLEQAEALARSLLKNIELARKPKNIKALPMPKAPAQKKHK
ncbi:helix-turn-helix transcriptional regulator [Candidatus Saccharibacteria bacterium]|nr:helix-turn-helix transcriptional regulator [Candidatus Saccharibacteria bacterium]